MDSTYLFILWKFHFHGIIQYLNEYYLSMG